ARRTRGRSCDPNAKSTATNARSQGSRLRRAVRRWHHSRHEASEQLARSTPKHDGVQAGERGGDMSEDAKLGDDLQRHLDARHLMFWWGAMDLEADSGARTAAWLSPSSTLSR